MSEAWRIVLTASITIAGGIAVYTFGHLFVALFIEPIYRLRSLVGEIADSLVFYAPVYGNPGAVRRELADEAGETLRRQASQLRARVYSIPWYSLWAFMGLVREKTEIEEASAELIGLSNSVHGGPGVSVTHNIKMERRIKELLGVRGSRNQKQGQTINWHAMSDGILLFIFGLLLLAVKQVSETPTWGLIPILGLIPAPPISFSITLRIILIVISLILMIVILWRWQAYKRAKSLKERLKKAKYLIIFFLFLLLLFVLWLIPPIPVYIYTALGIIAILISLAFMVAVFYKRLADKLEEFLKSQFSFIYGVIFWTVFSIGFAKGLSSVPVESFTFPIASCIGFIWFLIIGIIFLRAVWQPRKR